MNRRPSNFIRETLVCNYYSLSQIFLLNSSYVKMLQLSHK